MAKRNGQTLEKMMSYWGRQIIAKKNTWFKYGTQVFVVDDYGDGTGLFRGIRVCQNPDAENHTLGEEYGDEEICSFDEFHNIPLHQGIIKFLDSVED
jgi:hypothetical protein